MNNKTIKKKEISFRNILTDTPEIKLGQISGHPVAQSS
jgi:hypothetical protein